MAKRKVDVADSLAVAVIIVTNIVTRARPSDLSPFSFYLASQSVVLDLSRVESIVAQRVL